MATIASLNIDLTASTALFKQALDKATQDLQVFGGKTEGILERLNKSFGRGSGVMEWAHLFDGGGPIRGLSLATKEFEEMTKRSLEFKKELDDGAISSFQFANELAKSIPILGEIIGAGENLNELFTGDNAAIQRAKDLSKALDDARIHMQETFKAGQQSAQDMLDIVDKLRVDIDLIGATPADKKLADVAGDLGSKLSEVMGKAGDGQDNILNPAGRDSYASLIKQIADKKKEIDDAVANVPKLQTDLYSGTWDGASQAGNNQADIDAANEHIADLRRQLTMLDSDAKARRIAASPTAFYPVEAMFEKLGAMIKSRNLGADENVNPSVLAIYETLHKAVAQYARLGKDAADGFIKSFKSTLGLNDHLFGETFKRQQEHFKQMQDHAKGLIESFKTPMQRLQEDMKQLNFDFFGGAINGNDYSAAMNALVQKQREIEEVKDRHERIRMPDITQRAREFRFTEGIPGSQQGNVFEKVTAASTKLAQTMQQNNNLLLRNNQLLDSSNRTFSSSDNGNDDDFDISDFS